MQRDNNGRYRLGLKTVELYNIFMKNNSLRAVARSYGGSFPETQETVYLGVLNGEEVSYLEKVDGPSRSDHIPPSAVATDCTVLVWARLCSRWRMKTWSEMY